MVPKIIQTVYIFMVPNNINKILLLLNIKHYCLQNVIRSLLGRNYWKNNQKVKRFLQQQSTVLMKYDVVNEELDTTKYS